MLGLGAPMAGEGTGGIAVGYRLSSKRGTQFRIWATRVLRDHIVKGYTLNERRLKELHQAVGPCLRAYFGLGGASPTH